MADSRTFGRGATPDSDTEGDEILAAPPAVSVGLPVYNGERFLAESLGSILAQTVDDLEVVITDNASTDATPEICRDFAAGDGRVRYIRNERNLGAAANYNRAFAESRGRYFKWLAHDDVYEASFIERCLEILEAHADAVACYSPARFIDESGRALDQTEQVLELGGARPSERLERWMLEKTDGWCHPVTGIIRSDVLARTPRIGAFVGSDMTLVAELLLHGPVHRTGERLFLRRDHAGRSVSAHRTTTALTEWFDTGARRVRARMPWWRMGSEVTRAVLRVPMTPLEKCRCGAIMARWFARMRGRLKEELMHWAEGTAPTRS